uniref:Uncharacterized protein n=1 Tax=Romanomermis culicivorax TaxID=13658 RepID=A0A915I5S5_ROMCU
MIDNLSIFTRFWYQNPGVFAPDQLAELEKVRFSRIICDNSDEFRTISLDAFEFTNSTANLDSCSKIPSIDLSKWADQ